MKYFIIVLGFVLAKTPEFVLRGICCFIAWFVSTFLAKRMRVAYRNLEHCFPEKSDKERRAIAKESVRRMVEMGLFVLASPHIPLDTLKKRIGVDAFILEELANHSKNPTPILLLLPHVCMVEAVSLMPALVDVELPPVGVIYRPFDNSSIEDWVKKSRERCGITLLSRKNVRKSVDFLNKKGAVALLFDQNAGKAGLQNVFFDMICSTTELPRILAEHKKADVAMFYAKRTGFWRAEISGEWLNVDSANDISTKMNVWLENKLRTDEQLCRDWLWLHQRWERFNAFALPKMREDERECCLKLLGGKFKRKYKYVITPPSSLRGTLALIPLIKALYKSRPDAELTLVCEKRFYDVLLGLDFPAKLVCAPNVSNKIARMLFFRKLRMEYFDTHVVFEDSLLADVESKLLMPSISFAIESKYRKRKFIRFVYKADYASEADSLLSYYEAFMRRYSLEGEIDLSPLDTPMVPQKNKIGIICGGTGNHVLSAEKWGQIIKKLDKNLNDFKFVVYGDDCDCHTAFEITRTAEYAEIKSLAGKLSDSEIMSELKSCSLVVGTDCRLTHIANALGVRVVAVYGPTNPVRNGLVFDAPKSIVRPRNSPIQGGVDVENIYVDDVVAETLKFINQ